MNPARPFAPRTRFRHILGNLAFQRDSRSLGTQLAIAMLPLSLAIVVVVASAPSRAGSRKQFEYTCMNRSKDVTVAMNALGVQGWELVAAASGPAPSPFDEVKLDSLAQQARDLASQLRSTESASEAWRKRAQPLMVWCFKRPR